MFINKISCLITIGKPLGQLFLPSVNQFKFNSSASRFKYDKEIEDAINVQIGDELAAALMYLSLSTFFKRNNIDLPGFASMFNSFVTEEFFHAKKLIKYQGDRGGVVKFSSIQGPKEEEWTPFSAVQYALEAEQKMTESLISITEKASKLNDLSVASFITEFMPEQYDSIKVLGSILSKIDACIVNPIATTLLDQQLQAKYGEKH